MTVALDELLRPFTAIHLDALDERASLQRRVDRKYVLPESSLVRLLDDVRVDHEALEIDGRREFVYESVYFDDERLSLFAAHVAGRTPRAKVRSRLYRDTERCVLEVKVRLPDGRLDKRQADEAVTAHGGLDERGRRFVDDVLREIPDAPRAAELQPTLTTAFRRATIGALEGAARATIDVGVRLTARDGRAACLRDDLAVVETKTHDGDGRIDRLLRDGGIHDESLSKYRLGVGLLLADDPDPPLGARRSALTGPC